MFGSADESRLEHGHAGQGSGGPGATSARPATFLWKASPAHRRRVAPVVYLPGLGPHGTGRTPGQRLLQRFEVLGLARTFDVWLVGRRTPVRQGSTIADIAAEHASAIRRRFDRPVDVVGESTGGSIALQLALDHPEVVERLVLVSAAARLRESGEEAQARAADRLRAGRARAAAAILLGTTTDRPMRKRLLSAAGFVLGRLVIGRDDGDLVRIMDAEDGFDLRCNLAGIEAPTLLIGGGRGGYYSRELFDLTATRIPTAVHIDLPRKGHLSAMLDPKVGRLIREHLDATTNRRPTTPGPP